MTQPLTTPADVGPGVGTLSEITCVSGDTFCVSGSNGQVKAGRYQGLYIRDTRALSQLLIRVDGEEPPLLHGRAVGAKAARFAYYQLPATDVEVDPKLVIERRRVVSESVHEDFVITNFDIEATTLVLEIVAATDFAYIFDVKHGRVLARATPAHRDGMLCLQEPTGHRETMLRPSVRPDEIDDLAGSMRWTISLAPKEVWAMTLDVGYRGSSGTKWPSQGWDEDLLSPDVEVPHRWTELNLSCNDERMTRLLQRSVMDLGSLIIRDPEAPEDRFLAAGSPWFLTLFGRDSILSAQMLLPLEVSLSGETLRVLARRQGREVVAATEEAPGKILHEIRHGGLVERGDLPPLYYGSMDSTPLFVRLANEAWRWGLADDEVEALMPAVEKALAWMRDYGDADGDGFLEYIRSGDRGLSNQGWKDSGDAVQFMDGRLADPPIALCEVQGYAYDAARRGAELLAHFGRPGADEWLEWSDALERKFRESFWVSDADGPYPAMALDGAKRPVDAIASNMGHLLACGILNEEECDIVANRLIGRDLNSGWGLRTLSTKARRFNPLSYHGGSIWPHDSALAIAGLARTGHGPAAKELLRGLAAAAPFFDYRLPELFAGEQRGIDGFPLPYPAACRPQAWAAASALLIARSIFGFEPDFPAKTITLRPVWPAAYQRVEVSGVQVGNARLSATLIADRGVWVDDGGAGFNIEVLGAPRLMTRPEDVTLSNTSR